MEPDDPRASHRPQEAPIWHGLVSGAVAGILSRLVVFPADTLKARLQLYGTISTQTSANTLSAVSNLYKSEGLRGFYRGFGAIMIGVVPAQAAYFGGYELGRRLMPQQLGVVGDMGTGCIAQLVAGIAYTPVDIIKERLQVRTMMQGRIPYHSAVHAIWDIVKAQGAGGLMRGYWATNSVWIPWNILYISMFEALKRSARKHRGLAVDSALPATVTAASSMVAASAAGIVTHPADVIKTRLQVLTASGQRDISFASITRRLLAQEGLLALWSGLAARLVVLGPGAGLTWAIYEEVKAALAQQ